MVRTAEKLMCTSVEACELLSVSQTTLLALQRSGRITGQKIKRQWRYSVRSLMAFAESAPAPAARSPGRG